MQIDLLIDRSDHTVTLCEAKFGAEELTVSRTLLRELTRKRAAFKAHTGTRKRVGTVLLTVYGAHKLAEELDAILTIDALL